jgi:hypothetical protein
MQTNGDGDPAGLPLMTKLNQSLIDVLASWNEKGMQNL